MKLTMFIALISSIFLGLHAQENQKRHVEVRVELQNESTLEGIVVDGKFYEKYNDQRNRWQTMPSRKGSGLRLWHVEKAEGFIFLRYEDIRRIEEIGKKSNEELRELREEIRLRLQREREEYEKRRQAQRAAEAAEADGDKVEDAENVEGGGEEEKTDGLDKKTLEEYQELLDKYPPEKFSLAKTIQAVKIRMNSGIPLARKHKEFLTRYPTWRKAVAHKNEKAPREDYTKEELHEAKLLMAKFPPTKYELKAKVNKLAINALNEIPMFPDDAEWFSVLDKWLDAHEILRLAKKKRGRK